MTKSKNQPRDQERLIQRLGRWFHEGPDDDDSTLGWMLGMAVWWRIQAGSAAVLAVALTAALSAAYLDALTAAFVSAAVGFWAGGWTTRVSPKYDVTKNF